MKTTDSNSPSKTKIFLATALATAMIGYTSIGSASIDSKMDSIFNDMTNVTAPGMYNTARRGILSGGSIVNRSRIVNTQLFNLAAPHISAGCGGIDIFGGSFSFINAEQFVQLLRSIAANAKGYAFKVALDAASSFIGVNLDELQRAIQLLNGNNINSCQLAQGIVNSAAGALGIKTESNVTLTSALQGYATDVGEAFGHFGNVRNKELYDARHNTGNESLKAELDKNIGNIVFKVLKKRGARSMFLGADANETSEYEYIMSITGTVVVSEPKESADAGPVQNHTVKFVEPSIQDPTVLSRGGTISISSCQGDNDECLNPLPGDKTNVTGLESKLNAIVSSVVNKLQLTGNASKLTADEEKVWYNLPPEASTILTQMVDIAPAPLDSLQHLVVNAVIGKLLFDDMLQYIDAVIGVVGLADVSPENKDAQLNQLKARRTDLINRRAAWYKDNPTIHELAYKYVQGTRQLTIGGKQLNLPTFGK